MVRLLPLAAALAAVLATLLPSTTADAADRRATAKALAAQMRSAGSSSGALFVELDSGRRIYGRRLDGRRVPASVQKLYTSTAALVHLGPDATLTTSVASLAPVSIDGVLDGDLFLVGGGDPTLTTGDLEDLAAHLVATTGLTRVTGRVVGDESLLDGLRGPPSSGYAVSSWVGPLGGLVVDRGRTGRSDPYWQPRPAVWAASALARALRREGVVIRAKGRAGAAPEGALPLGYVQSPPVSSLLALQNVPSDNYIAETLLKVLGARAGAEGTTASGADVVEEVTSGMGLHPRVADGSGLSRSNLTTPRQVVRLLRLMARRDDFPAFYKSLAIAGRTGTLYDRMRRSGARRRCRGKTGTLYSVSALAGYCRTRTGDRVAFAILMNGVSPYGARRLQDRMLAALVRYEP